MLLANNEQAVRLFLEAQGLWRLRPDGTSQGLDYAGLAALMGLRGIENPGATLDDLRILEGEALMIDASRRERDGTHAH